MMDVPEEFATLARNVRRLRRSKDWSQQELADRCQLDRTTVLKIERGDHAPSTATILLLAQALNQPIWVLFFDTERRTSATRLIRALFERASAPIRRAIVMFARRLAKTPATST